MHQSLGRSSRVGVECAFGNGDGTEAMQRQAVPGTIMVRRQLAVHKGNRTVEGRRSMFTQQQGATDGVGDGGWLVSV